MYGGPRAALALLWMELQGLDVGWLGKGGASCVAALGAVFCRVGYMAGLHYCCTYGYACVRVRVCGRGKGKRERACLLLEGGRGAERE